MFTVLCCGSRHWKDYDAIYHELEQLKAEHGDALLLLEGGQRSRNPDWRSERRFQGFHGADWLVKMAAADLRINVHTFPADWTKYGRGAGPKRNERMLREGQPDLVLAFTNDISKSPGTYDMVTKAEKAGVPVHIVSSIVL